MTQPIAAQDAPFNENDLKQNRLGLMSQHQIDDLQHHIDIHQQRIQDLMRRAVITGGVVTLAIVAAVVTRMIRLPLAVVIEILVVGGMVYMTTDFNRFIQQLMLDREARAVRIVKGRASRYTMRSHPLYQSLRVEVHNYKVLDSSLFRLFENGELYVVYILPQSRTVIATEKLSSKSGYLIN